MMNGAAVGIPAGLAGGLAGTGAWFLTKALGASDATAIILTTMAVLVGAIVVGNYFYRLLK